MFHEIKTSCQTVRLYGTTFLMSEGIKTPLSDCQVAHENCINIVIVYLLTTFLMFHEIKTSCQTVRLYDTTFLMSEGIKTPLSDCQAAKCAFGTTGAIFLEHLSIQM